jgi:hypothetical protein
VPVFLPGMPPSSCVRTLLAKARWQPLPGLVAKARPTCFGRLVCVFDFLNVSVELDQSMRAFFKDTNKIVSDPRRFDQHVYLAIDSKVGGSAESLFRLVIAKASSSHPRTLA